MMAEQLIIVLVTAPSKEVGEQIAASLLRKKLAACVNIVSPVTSLYTWQGQSQRDEEVLLIIKSRASLFSDKLVPAIISIHPYETPEILALPILMGSKKYIEWMTEVTE